MTWTRRHILGLADFTTAEYDIVLQTAASFSDVLLRPMKKVPALQGRVVTNLFFDDCGRYFAFAGGSIEHLESDDLRGGGTFGCAAYFAAQRVCQFL